MFGASESTLYYAKSYIDIIMIGTILMSSECFSIILLEEMEILNYQQQ